MVNKIGFWAGLATTAAIALFDVGAALDISGIGIGSFALAMAWLIAPSYVTLLVALHQRSDAAEQLWTLLALVFALIYAAVVSVNYPLQMVMLEANPAALGGWTMQLRPDSAFWALEVAAYLFMGASGLWLLPLLWRHAGSPRLAALLLAVNGAGTLLGAIAYYGTGNPGHWLAMASLAIWGIVFPAATLLLALQFRSAGPLQAPD